MIFQLPFGGGARGGRAQTRGRAPRPLLAALGLFALLASGCGQLDGVHVGEARVVGRTGGGGAVRLEALQSSAAARIRFRGTEQRNGENSGRVSSIRYTRVRATSNRSRRDSGSSAPLEICPVQGAGFLADDFGAPRYAGGYHPHAGNDVFTRRGTPVVAPFDGVALAAPNPLGGLAVRVHGTVGYVYNAHLSRYGKLGSVQAGDVVGYVGNTGDAGGGPPHNHFEFHPGGGRAVDPHPYLLKACT